MPLTEFRDEVSNELSEFAWRQWSQMGILTSAGETDDRPADPEALLLLSLEVGRDDPRLHDEVSDWVLTNRHRLSFQRLRNLCNGPEDRTVVDPLIAWTTRHQKLGQQSLLPALESSLEGNEDIFFRTTHMKVGTPDASYLESGLLRPSLSPSFRSQEPEFLTPINLAFRLRAILGTGVRAEIVRVLLARPQISMSVSELSRDTAYSKRNVQESSMDLVKARVIVKDPDPGPARFRIIPERWFRLLFDGDTTVEYRPWPGYLGAYRKLLQWLWTISATDHSDYLVANSAASLLEQLAPLDMTGESTLLGMRAGDSDFMDRFEEFVRRSFRELRPTLGERAA